MRVPAPSSLAQGGNNYLARRLAALESVVKEVSASPWTAPEALSALVLTLEELPPDTPPEEVHLLVEALCRLPSLCPLLPNEVMFATLGERVESAVGRVCKSSVDIALKRFPAFVLLLLRLMELRPSHIPSLHRLLRRCFRRLDSSITLPQPQSAVRQTAFRLRQRLRTDDIDPELFSVGNNGCMVLPNKVLWHPPATTRSPSLLLQLWPQAVETSSRPLDACAVILTQWMLAGKPGRLRIGLRVLAAELNELTDACHACRGACRPALLPSWMLTRPAPRSPPESRWKKAVELSTRLPSADLLLLGLVPEIKAALRREDSLLLGLLGSTAVMLVVYSSTISVAAQRAFVTSVVDMAVECEEENTWRALATSVAYIWLWIAHSGDADIGRAVGRLVKEWRGAITPYIAIYFCVSVVPLVGNEASRLLQGVEVMSGACDNTLREQLLYFEPATGATAVWHSDTLTDIRKATFPYLRKLLRIYEELLCCAEEDSGHPKKNNGRLKSMRFPPEVCELIMIYLSPRRCGRLALVSKEFLTAFHSPCLWKQLYLRTWPQHIFVDEILEYCGKRGWIEEGQKSVCGISVKCRSCYSKSTLKNQRPCQNRACVHDWHKLFKERVCADVVIRGKVASDGFVARICKVVGCLGKIRWRKQEKVIPIN